MDIVDAHAHVIARDRDRYPLDPPAGGMSAWARERPVDAAEMLARMDDAGIARSILVTPSTAYGYDNAYAAAVAAAHPRRFAFVGAVDVRRADAPATMARWVRERGMVGVRLFAPPGDGERAGMWLASAAMRLAWEAARDLGITLSVHAEPDDLEALGAIAAEVPGVRVLLDHCGLVPVEDGPPYAAAAPLFALAARPNVHVKVSSRTLHALIATATGVRPFVERCIAAFGAHRMAWASNFPSSPGSLPALRDLAAREFAFLNATERAALFRDTALRLYA